MLFYFLVSILQVDTNDRFLRHITVGDGGEEEKYKRKTGFDITVAR